jgi:tetratricopeptide (TPR) repeat protein
VEEVRALNRRAVELYGKGEYAEAFGVGERALSLAEKTLGAEHPNTLTTVESLASLYERQGRYSEAGPLRKRASRRR